MKQLSLNPVSSAALLAATLVLASGGCTADLGNEDSRRETGSGNDGTVVGRSEDPLDTSTGSGSGGSGTNGSGGANNPNSSGGSVGAGGGSDGSGGLDGTGGGDGTGGAVSIDDLTPASDITIKEVFFNQGVSIPFVEDGAAVAPDARRMAGNIAGRIVTGRGGLFRILWETQSGWSNRELEARLTLYRDGVEEVLTDRVMISGAPDRSNIDKTFSFVLKPEQVTAGMKYSVGLFEITKNGMPPASPPRIPAAGEADFGAPDQAMRLEIVMVAVTVGGVAPNLSAANVQKIHDGYYDTNAVADLVTSVRAQGVTASGSSIDAVLNATIQARQADNVANNVYYIGLAPVDKVGWSGVATGGSQKAAASPMSNTVNHPQEDSIGFIVHETGHTQGMAHTPGCGAGGATNAWPYGNSTNIASQGYGITTGKLFEVNKMEDYMNYCTPDWQSPFTYDLTYSKILSQSREARQPQRRSNTYVLNGMLSSDGSETWWAAATHLADSSASSSVRLQVTLDSGLVLSVQGQEQEIADSETVWIQANLPKAPSEIRSIVVSENGKKHDVALKGLTSKYDELRRQIVVRP